MKDMIRDQTPECVALDVVLPAHRIGRTCPAYLGQLFPASTLAVSQVIVRACGEGYSGQSGVISNDCPEIMFFFEA